MDKRNRQEWIEAFLRDELSAEEQKKFQEEMKSDPELNAQVKLHRMMQEEFGDREKQAFIQRLDVHADQYFGPSPGERKRWWKWLIGLGGIAVLLLGLWLFLPFDFNPPVEPPTDEEVSTPSEFEETKDNSSDPDQRTAPDPESTPTEERPSPPIAQLDPADLAPNPYFENLIGSTFRGEEIQFSDVNVWYSPGQVRVEGRIKKVPSEDGTLMLFIYSNKEQDYLEGNAILSTPVELQGVSTEEAEQTAAGETLQAFRFSTTQSVDWKGGLYYFFLAWQRDEEPLYTGKFQLSPN